MADLLITELARTSGFSSSALRYYERLGLLSPRARTPGGYRLYDDRSVERLAFIARAKRLGLDLHQIRDLVALWAEGPCGPVQERLRALLDDKIELLESQIHEFARFHAQLVHVQHSLASSAAADRCGPGCGCDTELPGATEIPISRRRPDARSSEPETDAIVCTLDADDASQRARDWQSALDLVEERQSAPHGVRLRFPTDADVLGSLATLTAREVECCSFFTFTLTLDAHAAWLTISAPPSAESLVMELFGPVDG